MRIGSCVTVVVLVSTLLAPATAHAIVNGTAASAGEYPAQALLLVTTGEPPTTVICGGTLVGSRQILTAAQCAANGTGAARPAAAFQVRLGILDRTSVSADTYAVSAVVVHPQFNPSTLENDVAVLTLDRVANYPLARVVTSAETGLWAPGVQARAIGWGALFSGGPLSDSLRAATIPIISNASCSGLYPPSSTTAPPSIFFAASMVCAMDAPGTLVPHDTCAGDTGGPLLVFDGLKLVLAGITSWGIGCADGTHPGVYTRIGAEPLNTWVHQLIDPPPPDTDGDGVPDASDACPSQPAATANGCPVQPSTPPTVSPPVVTPPVVTPPVVIPPVVAPPAVTPPKPSAIRVSMSMTATVTGARTTITTLAATKVPAGSKVAVRCMTTIKGCPFASKVATVRLGKANLLTSFGGKRTLRSGAVVEVRVTKAGMIGQVVRYTMRKGKLPLKTALCTAPGSTVSRPTC